VRDALLRHIELGRAAGGSAGMLPSIAAACASYVNSVALTNEGVVADADGVLPPPCDTASHATAHSHSPSLAMLAPFTCSAHVRLCASLVALGGGLTGGLIDLIKPVASSKYNMVRPCATHAPPCNLTLLTAPHDLCARTDV
jgi:hypothetical protein